MKDITLLLTEADVNHLDHCKAYLAQQGIDVIACTRDGNAAYGEIVEKAPTCALLDLFMPGLDAISLKRKYDEEHKGGGTSFFATGAVQDDFIESKLVQHGFQFYFLKPYDVKSLADWIGMVARADAQAAPKGGAGANEATVTAILREIGVPAHVKGYRYLRDAIVLVIDDPSLIYAVTKILYPEIATSHSTTTTRVERAIRHAIEIAWDRGDLQVLDRYFGGTVDAMRGKPTNSEFIAMLADHVHIGGPSRMPGPGGAGPARESYLERR